MATARNVLTEAEKANALLDWFIEQLGPGFAVERPVDVTRWSEDRIWRYYVAHRHQRSVIWVSVEFLKRWAVSEFPTYLLASPPTVLELIRAGAPYITVGETGRARDLGQGIRGS